MSDDIYNEIKPTQSAMGAEVAKKYRLASRDTSIVETVPVMRGKRIRLVGHRGGTSINLDIHSGHDITCAEVDRESAQHLVALLNEFLRSDSKEGQKR